MDVTEWYLKLQALGSKFPVLINESAIFSKEWGPEHCYALRSIRYDTAQIFLLGS
jgi:hypothetical protein